MRARLLGLAVVAITSCAANGAKESGEPQPDVDDAAIASAVDIRAIGCKVEAVRGAGAVIDGGFVLTAAHVVAGAKSISIRPATPNGARSITVHVAAIDAAADLALLSGPGERLPSLSLGRASARDRGVAIVFRDSVAIALPFTITRPVTVRIFDIYHAKTISRDGYQVEIEIEPGDSGAILVGPKATADGVLYAKSQDTENRAWATSTSVMASLIDRAKQANPDVGIDPGPCAH